MSINRVLIVGLGSIGKRHLRLARTFFPHANIQILRHQATEELAEHSNGNFFDLDEALNFSPQIAVIANPAPFHVPIAQALAEVGTHLLIEKPLSTSLDGVSLLLETCEKNKTVLQIGYNLRFLPSLQTFKSLLDQGIIGRILSVRCEIGQYLPSWRPESDYRNGVSARLELGGGVLLEISHEIDYLRWIFGEVDWVIATLSKQSSLEIDVEDSAHLILGFATSSEGNQLIGVSSLDFIRHDSTRECTAIGEIASLRWNGLKGTVELFKSGANSWQEIFKYPHQRDESYIAEWQNFIECVKKSRMPFINGEDGIKVLQIIKAARNSAALGGAMCKVNEMNLAGNVS